MLHFIFESNDRHVIFWQSIFATLLISFAP